MYLDKQDNIIKVKKKMTNSTKKWRFIEYTEKNHDGYEYTLTEREIFEKTWSSFYQKMYDKKYDGNPNVERLRAMPLAKQVDACIDEYIVVNWGYRVKDE